MGLEMSPGIVVAKLDTMNVSLSRIIDHAQKMIYEISELENTKDQLAGEAYDCIRNHFADMHTAVVRAVILYAEAMIQENNSYKGYINGYLGGMGYVNEDKLKEDRYALKDQINRAYSLMIATKCGSYSSWISSMEYALRLIEDKLSLIGDFKAASGGLYSDIDSYKATLENGIESLHSAVFDGKTISYPVDYIDRGWKHEVESRWGQREQRIIETIKEPFVQNMETHFGFDRETSEILYKLYEEMEVRGEENIDQKFFLMMASIVYSYKGNASREMVIVPKSLDDLWYVLLGTYTISGLDAEMVGFGLSEDEIEKLKNEIKSNYENSSKEDEHEGGRYTNKSDFAHMSVIIALYLSPEENIWTKCGDASGVFNGIYDLEGNAGYVGDVYGTAGNGPKLTPDDYKADLDAVNLSARIPKGDNLIVTMNEYYSGINSNDVNRADEFAANIGNGSREAGIELLDAQRDRHMYYLANREMGASVLLTRAANYQRHKLFADEVQGERQKIIDYFYFSVATSQNEYSGKGKVDIHLAEEGEQDEN